VGTGKEMEIRWEEMKAQEETARRDAADRLRKSNAKVVSDD
jgi:hypothetical protein